MRAALLVVMFALSLQPVASVGGWSAPKPLDDRTRGILQQLQPAAEQRTNQRYAVWRPEPSYRSQVVAGTNYLFTVDVGVTEKGPLQRLELKAFMPLPYTRLPVSLQSVTQLGAAAPSPSSAFRG